jgi:hypothetical protein
MAPLHPTEESSGGIDERRRIHHRRVLLFVHEDPLAGHCSRLPVILRWSGAGDGHNRVDDLGRKVDRVVLSDGKDESPLERIEREVSVAIDRLARRSDVH